MMHGWRSRSRLIRYGATGWLLIVWLAGPVGVFAQGRKIRATDGDTVVVDGEARVNVMRTRSAHIRVVFNHAERWLIVLAQFTDRPSRSSGVDDAFVFREAEGTWPLAARWEGDATIETYFAAGEGGGAGGYGIRAAGTMVQLFARDSQRFRSPDATSVMSYRGSGRSTANAAPFDDVERAKVAEVRKGHPNPTISVTPPAVVEPAMAAGAVLATGVAGYPPTDAIRKIHDVAPVWPEAARQANVRGMVIVQLTIGTDGSVTEASILRGIPLLNDAALACVRQWRYEPVLLNGRPLPSVITASVSFP